LTAGGAVHKFTVDQSIYKPDGLTLGMFALEADRPNNFFIFNKGTNGFVIADAGEWGSNLSGRLTCM